MILFFSGNGNSRFAANSLGRLLDEETRFIPDTNPYEVAFNGTSLGIVCPVYSWGIPPIVLDFVDRLNEGFVESASAADVWIVLTAGDETGNAPEMLEAALHRRGLTLRGGWSVIMPNTYVILPGFDVDSQEVAAKKLDGSKERLNYIAAHIKNRKFRFNYVRGKMANFKSGVIYPMFKTMGINPRKWHWTQECIGCGKCAAACPVGNVTMKGGHPEWGNDCTSCLACYHHCPTHAVEYGRRTVHKGRYTCHLK